MVQRRQEYPYAQPGRLSINIICARENMITVANHFSHNGGLTYVDTVEKMKEYGIFVPYDGMEIEI